ncbi:MAG: 2-hydroxyacyl-CoA dehydratase [Chloroflexi bacterium]|nr:2-hydroxyacyl-CoA dehydratase [Chloroflexota bacterium]
MTTVGITTTVPIEVLLAAGCQPVDLNNLFISSPEKERMVTLAERAGFPQNICAWIKGIYGTCMERDIDTVLCVTSGDCSNTLMLMDVLKLKGVRIIPFAYPDRRDPIRMHSALQELAASLGTSLEAAEEVRQELAPARILAHLLDERTWRDGKVSGWENHLWLVSTSDFNSDRAAFERELAAKVSEVDNRPRPDDMLRLAHLGVPSIFAESLYRTLEALGARVVFNEIQRQFSMPGPSSSLAEQYTNYTYPYSVFDRLADITPQLALRQIDGVIHYVQAFCHRGIGDIIMRDAIKLPILTLEGNADFLLTEHQRTRIEAFLDIVRRQKARQGAVSDQRSAFRPPNAER